MINAVEIQDLGMQDYKQMHSRMLELNAMKEDFKIRSGSLNTLLYLHKASAATMATS